MKQKNTSAIIALAIIMILIVIGGVYFYIRNNVETVVNAPSEVLSDTEEIPTFVEEKEITLSPGETGEFQGLSVKFDKVTEDSRCPTSVNCITAGKVTAKFTLSESDMMKTVLISSDDAEPYSFLHYFIEMKEVRPTKVNPGNLDPNSYEVVLLVSRNAKL